MGGNLLYRELPKKAEGAVDVGPMPLEPVD